MFSKIVLIAIFAVTLCQLSQQKAVTSAPDFSGCEDEYQCVGLPKGCLDKETDPDCQVLLKTQPLKDGIVEFNLIWERPANSSDSWVAAALSSDQKMGDDSATVFIIDANGTVVSEEGLTFVNKQGGGFTPKQVDGITIEKDKFVNNRLTTKWIRKPKTKIDKLTFDMQASKFYILLAYGPVKDGKIGHHTGQGMSAQALNLEEDPTKPTTKPSTSPTKGTSPSASTVPSSATSSKTSGSSVPTGGSTATAPTTVATTEGNSTATGTESPSNTTTPRATTTSRPPKTTTPKGKSGVSPLTMSLFLTIFVAILVFLN